MARNPWSPHLDSITWGPNTIAARFPTALKPKKELSYQTIENRRFGITVNSLKEVSFLGDKLVRPPFLTGVQSSLKMTPID